MRFEAAEWHDRLTSTNTVLLSRLSAGEVLPSGFVLAAREQTAGRGRYDRNWVSRPGRDLAFWPLVVTSVGFPRLSSLTMAVALGVADALEGFGLEVQTKWPNDLLVGGCKICGILAERPERSRGPGDAVVVGVGVNVNMEGHEAVAIDRPATSVLIETRIHNPIERVLDRILAALPPWIDLWEEDGFPALHDGWFRRHAAMGEPISVGDGENLHKGVLAGFGEFGQLLLRGQDGVVREIWAGDVGLL